MPYVEERSFDLRFELRCEFPEDYDGELDGYEWAKEFPAIANEVIRAAVQATQRRAGWRIRPGNRGASSDREVTLVLERVVQGEPKPGPG
jgi:hypothetical protein